MNTYKRLFSEQTASAAVLFAISLTVLLGFVALVTDMGTVYVNKARMSDTLDSAVLAGGQELPSNAAAALAIAEQYALANGLKNGEFSFSISDDHLSITGTATRALGTHFARVFGFDTAEVYARAKARVEPVGKARGIVPFGVLESNFVYGEKIILKEGAGDMFYKGWFGCLRLGGSGADIYRSNVKHGYQEMVKINDIIDIEGGNNSGPTKTGIEYRINQCQHIPQCTINSYVNGCDRIIIVPIVRIEEINDGGAVSRVRVVSLAAFFVDQYVGQGIFNEVQGYFIEYHIPGLPVEGTPDYGLYTVVLCE